jgi:acyl carrier protein
MMDYLGVVREFVVENFLFGDDERLKEETSFIGSGIVDSTGVMELVAFLEERFEVRVEDEEVIPENLDSLVRVAAFLERKLNGG